MARPLVWMPPGGPLVFPNAEEAPADGLLMVGGDLTPERILLGYSRGIFPWYDEESPILWWSPDPRCALFTHKLHVNPRLRRTLRSRAFSFSVDTCFERVIRHCSEVPRPGQDGTWIVPGMIDAYLRLHEQGHAHSVEVWEDGELAGGLYGVKLGRVFFGESMFHLRPYASKAALIFLVEQLRAQGVELLDCQQATPHMIRFGAEELPRRQFLSLVRRLCAE